MKLLGSILLLFSASTISLELLGHDSAMLALMDRWGAETGQYTRIGLGIFGIILLRLPRRRRHADIQREPRELRPHDDGKADPMAELRNERAA